MPYLGYQDEKDYSLSLNSNTQYCLRLTMPSGGGTVTTAWGLIDGGGAASGTQYVKACLYSKGGDGYPDDCLGVSDEQYIFTDQADTWEEFTFDPPIEVPAGDFFLTLHCGTTSDVGAGHYDFGGASDEVQTFSDTYSDGPLDPYTGTPNTFTFRLSAYLLYETDRTFSVASIFSSMTCVVSADNTPPSRSVSVVSTFSSMTCVASVQNQPPARTMSVASIFNTPTCVAASTNAAPDRSLSVASIFTTPSCAIAVQNIPPPRTFSAVTALGTMTCVAAVTNIPPARQTSVASTFDAIACVATLTNVSPVRTVSVTSSLLDLSCAAAVTNTPPARTVSVASAFDTMTCVAAITSALIFAEAEQRTITWTAGAGATKYDGEFSANGTFSDAVPIFTGETGLSYLWTLSYDLVTADTDTCRIRVRSRDAEDDVSGWSTSVAFTVRNTLFDLTLSVASVFTSPTCVVAATNVPPARTLSVASSFESLSCAAAVTSVIYRTVAVASAFDAMSCAAQATNTPPSRSVSVAATFEPMTCASSVHNVPPARSVSVASIFSPLTCAATTTNTPPPRTLSEASVFAPMTCVAAVTNVLPERVLTGACILADLALDSRVVSGTILDLGSAIYDVKRLSRFTLASLPSLTVDRTPTFLVSRPSGFTVERDSLFRVSKKVRC